MNLEITMPEAPIDPQLELLGQGNAAESLQYSLSTSTCFEPWTSMFESIGEFPQPMQGVGMMDSAFQSDTDSSTCYSLGNEQDVRFPLSPLDKSPGNTSISTGRSESGASANKNASKATKGKKRHRRNRSATEKKELIKQRNRVAASKCRMKKKEKVDELKEIKSSLEARNNDLHMEFQRLRREIGQVKSDLIHHTECNDPNIDRWVENEVKGCVQKLVRNEEQERQHQEQERQRQHRQQRTLGNSNGAVDTIQMHSLHQVSDLQYGDPYMGLG
ncbi:hypothetical protein V8C37DRAFT_363861 [Trichoderma ceciliae]